MARKVEKNKWVGQFSLPMKFTADGFSKEYQIAADKAMQSYDILSPFTIDVYEYDPDYGTLAFAIYADRHETETEKEWRLELTKRTESQKKDREKADYEIYLALKKRFEGENGK